MLLVLLVACVHTVDVTLSAAEVAPSMANGSPWDGPQGALGPLTAEGKASLAAALGSLVGNAAVGTAVVGVASELQKPDAAGQLTFVSGAGVADVSAIVPEMSDTNSPRWTPGQATVKGVALKGSSSLRVALVDKDLQSDDPIGTVVLSSGQLLRALARDGVLTVETADQSSGQLLSVSILVVEPGK